jgi:hypothetical protein
MSVSIYFGRATIALLMYYSRDGFVIGTSTSSAHPKQREKAYIN